MNQKYFLQLMALSVLWSMSFPFTRYASPLLGFNLLVSIRMGLAALTLGLLMLLLKHRWPTEHWRELLFLGIIAVAGPHILYSWSALYLPAGYAALLSVTSVLFGAIASAWMRVEAMTQGRLAGCLLGIVGAALVVRLGPVEVTPILVVSALTCMLGSAMSGISAPLLKRSIERMEPLAITAGMHLAGALILLPGGIHDWPEAKLDPLALGAVLIMGVMTSGLAWWAFLRIMRHIPSVAALGANFMITGFGVLWGVIFLDEATSVALYAGGMLIFVAVMLVTGFNPLRPADGLGRRDS